MKQANPTSAAAARLPIAIAGTSLLLVGGLLWALAAAADSPSTVRDGAPTLAAVPADLVPLVALHRDFAASPVPVALRP